LLNASFIGFTGTPIEKTDANTRAVFGDDISIYDIQRAVADKATVPIYYEPDLTPARPRSVGLRPTRCVVYLSRLIWLLRFQALYSPTLF
jgi:type I site-specific restriction endonuclease